MAVRSRSDLSAMLSKLVGDRTDDDVITLMEDFKDTMDDYDGKIGEDWKSRYEQNDAEWRRRYLSRFNGTSPDEDFVNGTDVSVEVQETRTEQDVLGTADVTWDDIFV